MLPPDEPLDLALCFDHALDLDPAGRAAYVQRLGTREPRLARELRELLDIHASGPRFLDRPADLAGLAADELDAPLPRATADLDLAGRKFAGFQVLERVGRGGMSTVYEAQQTRPNRRIALKVLSPGSPSTHARFLDEAETLARLDHPSIAKIYDAGTASCQGITLPWMAMEFIEAPVTITDYADRNTLALPERVRLFLPLCQALHHAHQKGVLHRDLKPANLLISNASDAAPKVIDFGLARVLEPASDEERYRTRSGELLGTLAYMSPEQSSGDPNLLDVRTDVYGLGVVFYELVSGQLPYELEGLSLLQILERIRTTAPNEPGRIKPELAGDLAAVMLRALEKEPEQRYDSALALGRDLERWLKREPVEAKPPNLLHRLGLFARRRTALFVGLTITATLACAALASITFLYLENRAALAQVEQAQNAAAEQREQVEDARNDLRQLVGRLEGLLAEAVQRAKTARAAADSSDEQRAAVRVAIAQLDTLAQVLQQDAASAASLARAYVTVGDLHGSAWRAAADDAQSTLPAYQKGAELYRALIAARPERTEVRRELIRALVKVVQTQRKMERAADGLAAADEALHWARRGVAAADASTEDTIHLIEALWARGDLHISIEPHEQGLLDSFEALELAERLVEDRTDDEALDTLAWSLLRAGLWIDRQRDDAGPALALHRRGTDVRIELVARAERRGAQDNALPDAALLMYSMFLSNELGGYPRSGPQAQHVARIDELLAIGRALEPAARFSSLPLLIYLVAERMQRVPEAPENREWVRWIEDVHAELSPEQARATIAATAGQYSYGIELSGAAAHFFARFAHAEDGPR